MPIADSALWVIERNLEQPVTLNSITASCRAFTYVGRSRECWLKNAVGSAEPQSGVVSGTK